MNYKLSGNQKRLSEQQGSSPSVSLSVWKTPTTGEISASTRFPVIQNSPGVEEQTECHYDNEMIFNVAKTASF